MGRYIFKHILGVVTSECWIEVPYQRINGPVNAHLTSAVYTNIIENSPSIGADEALGPFFFQNNQYTVHTSFSLQMTF